MRQRGFTLVELVVVIGVILLLAGLTLSVGVVVVEQSERRQTEAVVHLLGAAVSEWERLADRKVTWGNGAAYEVHPEPETEFVFTISEILGVISRPPEVQKILAQIDPDFLYRYETTPPPWIDTPDEQAQLSRFFGSLTVLDAWGTPIYATHPGSPAPPGTEYVDSDGTIRTLNEYYYGIAPNRQIVFISAGPDGLFGLPEEFGTLGEGAAEAQAKARLDNTYSAPVTFVTYDY